MKRILPILVGFLLIAATTAQAQFTYTNADGSIYDYSTNADGSITIDGYSGLPWTADIPTNIEGAPVTSIADSAFFYCRSLTNVSIPSSVTNIGETAFYGCASLTSVSIGSGVSGIGEWAFDNCGSLTLITVDPQNANYTNVNGVLFDANETTLIQYPGGLGGDYKIPDGVTSIGAAAFADCGNLTNVTIPESVTSIGAAAFGSCESLTSVTIPDRVTSIGIRAFVGCSLTNVTIPDSVTNVGEAVFFICYNLTAINVGTNNPAYISVDGVLFNRGQTTLIEYPKGKPGSSYMIPESVTNIEDFAFAECTSLANVTIPDRVTSIGEQAFFVIRLTTVTIPDSVTSIGASAFGGNAFLTNAVVGNGVTNIGDFAFADCFGLMTIYFSGDAPTVGLAVFDGDHDTTLYYFLNTTGWSSPFAYIPAVVQPIYNYTTNADAITITGCFAYGSTVIIPAAINGLPVISIGDEAFFGTTMTTVTIPSSVTSIGDLAFYGCTNLERVTIPGSVTNIGPFAFYGCTSLGETDIPGGVTTIEDATFYECTSLTNATIADGVTSIEDLAFYGCTNLASVTLPDTVTNIGDGAFGNCTVLTNVYFDGNAPEVGSSVFFSDAATIYYLIATAGWTSPFAGLPAVELIPYSYVTNNGAITITGYFGTSAHAIIPSAINGVLVTSIGDGAFQGCNVATVTIPNSITNIGDSAFANCYSLTAVTIPNSVTGIGVSAFANCYSLTTIIIPNSITNIESGTFFGCAGLTNITIPGRVAGIGDLAFGYCSSLSSVTIPSSVASIGEWAFSPCTSLTNIYFDGNAPTAVSTSFNYDNATAYYLPGTTGWGGFSANTGVPAMLWNPLIQVFGTNFGLQNNQFGFNITGTNSFTVVVEACTDLSNPVWQPLQTNTVTNGSFYFSDPQWTNYPGRFYRISPP